MKGVLPETADILQKISSFDCIKDYVIMGGTALSLQIDNRASEDIDFCKWKSKKNEKIRIDFHLIENELSTIGIFKREILADNEVNYLLNGVKITFFCDNYYKQPETLKKIKFLNNIMLTDIKTIGIMKLDVMLRRSKFRDYYDIYSLLKAGVDFNNIVNGVLKYTNHKVRSRDVLSMLSDGNRFSSEENIKHLSPRYDVSSTDIENYLRPYIKNYNQNKKHFKDISFYGPS